MIRVLIVDDEPMARSKLRRLLSSAADVEVVGEAADAATAAGVMTSEQPDVVFLDIDLPGRSGLEFARGLDLERRPWIVFATAYAGHALDAFELEALDYLLKPFDSERVERVLERVRSHMRAPGGTSPEHIAALVARLESLTRSAATPYATRLVVEHGREVVRLKLLDVVWFASADNYVEVHAGAHCYLLRETLGSIETRVDPSTFARIHRGSIVNLERIASIHVLDSGSLEVVMAGGTRLPVGRSYEASLTRRWNDERG